MQGIEAKYDFYILTLRAGLSKESFVVKYFQLLNGKIYCTRHGVLLLALERSNREKGNNGEVLEQISKDAQKEKKSLAELACLPH